MITRLLIFLICLVCVSCSIKRPDNVPDNAVFITENWFELKEKLDSNKYRIIVYAARSGHVRVDAIFQIKDCLDKIDSNNILNHFMYLNKDIYLTYKDKPGNVDCKMKPIKIFETETFDNIRIEKKEEIKR